MNSVRSLRRLSCQTSRLESAAVAAADPLLCCQTSHLESAAVAAADPLLSCQTSRLESAAAAATEQAVRNTRLIA